MLSNIRYYLKIFKNLFNRLFFLLKFHKKQDVNQ